MVESQPCSCDLSVVGGHLALDLVNTVHPRAAARAPVREHLSSPSALLAWSTRLDVLDREEAERVARVWRRRESGSDGLRAALEIREATYDALLAFRGSTPAGPQALELLHRHWVAATGRSDLRLDPASEPSDANRLLVGTEPGFTIPDRLANAAVDLVRSVSHAQLKSCPVEEGGCGWLFLDRSHNGTRRWCSMEDCGSRAKARRLTERRREARQTGPV